MMRTLAIAFAYTTMIALTVRGAERVIDFEELNPGVNAAYDGKDGAGGFTSHGAHFNNVYSSDFGFWSNGWGYSTHTDSTTAGFMNQYSAWPGSGAGGSKTYGLAFHAEQEDWKQLNLEGAKTRLPEGFRPLSIKLANTTYAALAMRDGDPFVGDPYGANGQHDFFTLRITATNDLGEIVGEPIEVPLADTENSEEPIRKDWFEVDLQPLRGATQLSFNFNASRFNAFSILVPAYVAVDDLRLLQTPGDANADGQVNLVDFSLLKKNFGAAGSWKQGDFTGDAMINLEDFLVLKGNFGTRANIPEPPGVILLALAFTVGVLLWRRTE